MRKKTLICMIVLTIICIPLLTNKLPEVTGAFSLQDAEVVGMEAVYSALDTIVYWDVEFTWYPYLTMKGCNWRIIGLDSTWRTYDYYLTDDTYNINCTRSAVDTETERYRFYWNLTNFSPGDYTFESAPEGTASEASDTFGISSDPPSYYPQIDITAPDVFETFDSSVVSSITTSATLEDNGFLTDAEIFWDTTEVWNYSSFTPGANDKTYDIAITEGVTTNDTHEIIWTVTDNDGYEWNKTRHVIVYDGILMILMQKPDNYWQQNNNFDFQANFSESNGIDDARMYIYGCTFIGDDKVIVINNVESFLSYLQNYTISDDFYVYSYSLTYSDVLKWLIDYGYDDTGNKYGNRYDDWYVDDAGTFFASLTNDLFIDDNGNIYSLMNDYYVDDNGNVYGSENNLMIDDNGNVYTAENDYYVDDSGEKWYEFTDGSEYVVDSGDYSSAIVSYEEDDMSQQYGGVPGWGYADWDYRKNITITNPQSAVVGNDIPVYLEVTYDSDMQSDFDDLRFADSGGTPIDFDIGEYTASTVAHCWIETGSWTSTESKNIFMYYGNAGASSGEDEQSVWDDNGHNLIMHMGETSGNMIDSSGNGYDFTSHGSPDMDETGYLGQGIRFDDVNDYFDLGSASEIFGMTAFTMSVWAYFDEEGISEYNGFMSQEDDEFYFGVLSDGTYPVVCIIGAEYDDYYVGDQTHQTWINWMISWDGSSIEYMVNGVYIGADANTGTYPADDTTYIGNRYDLAASNFMDGVMDEMLISNHEYSRDEKLFYVKLMNDQASHVSWDSEEGKSVPEDWNVGANFDWTVSDATGERNTTAMTFWNTTAGAQGSVYVSDDDLANVKLLDDNYAISFEIRISCNDVTKIDAIGFAIEGTTGNYLKFAVTRWGFGICGASTSAISTAGMIAGYTSTDISWGGEWISLNITILGHSKVLYYYNDILLRDSVADNQYYDYTDVDCGSTTLSVDNYAGEVNGNMTIDYFHSSYFPGGRISDAGLLYYEYSDPSCTRYNDSWFLSSQAQSDVSGLYSNWGGGTWHPYRYNEHLKFSTRIRFDTEIAYNYWNSFGMTIGGTSNAIHIRMREDIGSDKVQMSMGNHTWGGYASTETSDFIVNNPFDGDWHVLVIEYHHNSYLLGTIDGILIANITYASNPEWFIWADPSNAGAGWGAWGAGNGVTGNYNSYMEIDYFNVYNHTYNGWTSNNGWDWNLWRMNADRNTDGIIGLQTDGTSDYGYMSDMNNYYANDGTRVMFMLKVRMNESATLNCFGLETRISGNNDYAFMSLFQNGTVSFGTTQDNWRWRSVPNNVIDTDYSFVENQWYVMALIVDYTNKWVSAVLDGQLLGNITLADDEDFDYNQNFNYLIVLEDQAGDTACEIDYLISGFRNDWWWVSSEGWSYLINTPINTVGYRDSGEIDIYVNTGNKRYAYANDDDLYLEDDHTKHLFEIKMKFINTSSEYYSFALGGLKITGGTFGVFAIYTNTTISCVIANGLGLYSIFYTNPFTWTFDNDYHTYSILVDYTNDWVAWIFDGQLMANYSTLCSWGDANPGFGFDGTGAVLSGVTIDYIQTGWRNDWWWVSSEGWSWAQGRDVQGNRADGYLNFYDSVAGSDAYIWVNDPYINDELYGADNSKFFIETKVKFPSAITKYKFFDLVMKVSGSYYYHITLFENGTLMVGTYSHWDMESGVWNNMNSFTFTWSQDTWYVIDMVMDVGNNWGAIVIDGQLIHNETYTEITIGSMNDAIWIIQNEVGQIYANITIDYVQSGWRNDWAWVSSEGWGWTQEAGVDYINRTDGAMQFSTDNSYAKIFSPREPLYAYSDAETQAYMVETKLRYLNSSNYQGIGLTETIGSFGGWKKAAIFYDFGDSKFSVGICADDVFTYIVWSQVFNFSTAWGQNSWTTLGIYADNTNNWISFFINGTLIANMTNIGDYLTYPYPYNPKLSLDVSAGQNFLEMDYLKTGWSDDWWWTSSSGWGWDTVSTGTTVGYQNGTRDGTNGEFYFWSEIDDGDTKITAHQADGLNWSGSYWTTEIRFQICNTTSHYDYVGGSAWVGGDTYVKAFWEYGTSGFRYGMYNNTNGAGDISNSIVSSLDTTYYGTMDNDWHTLRFQMKQTSWLGIYLDEKLIYNYTAVGNTKYLTGTLANVSFSLDSDASQNTRMVKIDYLKTGWTYGEYWGQTQNNTFWQIMDSDWFHSDGYRDDTNGVFDFWSKQDGDYANIYLDESYTNATGDAYYIGVNWTITNATGLYDYVSLATAVGGGNYFQMSWYGSTLEYGIDNTYLNGVFTDSLTTTLSWTPGTYHTWEYYIDLTGNIVTVWLDDIMLVNTTGWSAYLTGTAEDDLILGVDNDVGDTDAHVRVDSVFSGYKGWWSATYSEVGLTNYMNNTLPATWGEDIMVVHNSTQQCRFDATLTLVVNSTYYPIFENATGTTRTSTWQITDYVWTTYFSEGAFTVSVYLSSDALSVYWHNFTMYYDATAPTLGVRLKPTEPTGVYYADYPPGLDIYTLEWGLNDGQDNLVEIDLNNGDRVYDWIVTEEKPENFPTQVEYITRIEGDHILLVRAVDNAGNEANELITFTIVRRKPITFSFIASSGDAIPNYIAETYRIEINGFATDGLTGYTIYDSFTLGIYDVFGQTLYYGATASYSANIQVTLSTVHRVTFSNGEAVPIEITIQKTSGQQSFICAGLSDMTWFLEQSTYKIIADPMGAMRTRFTQFVATDYDLGVTSSGTNILALYLDFIEVDGVQGLSFSSITDMLNMATWMILFAVIISSVVVLRRLRPPLMRIEDEVVPQTPLLPIRITAKKQWKPKGQKVAFSSGKPKKQQTKDGKWVDIFA